MKNIGHFLNKKSLKHTGPIDEKSLSFVFSKIVSAEYGNRGLECLKMDHLENNNLFIRIVDSNWAGEAHSRKSAIIDKINKELGRDDVRDILFI